jgi:hypothetical protein
MADIFQNSYLTTSAGKSKDGDGNLFSEHAPDEKSAQTDGLNS